MSGRGWGQLAVRLPQPLVASGVVVIVLLVCGRRPVLQADLHRPILVPPGAQPIDVGLVVLCLMRVLRTVRRPPTVHVRQGGGHACVCVCVFIVFV